MSIHSHYRAGLWHPYEKPMYGVLLNPYHPLSHGLVGCWLFNEGGSNIVYDLSGQMNHGTISGATWKTEKFGSALSFDGSNDYAEVSNSISLNPTSSISVVAWIKSDEVPDSDKSIFRHDGHFTALQLRPGDCARVALWNPDLDVSFDWTWSTSFGDNQWHHFAVTYDENAGLKLYRDGDLFQEDATITGALSTTSKPFMIAAAEDGSEYAKIIVAQLLIYDKSLDANIIRKLYTDPFCMFYHPLEAELLYEAVPSAVGTPTLALLSVGR